MPRKNQGREKTRKPGVFRLPSGAWEIEAWLRLPTGARMVRRRTLDATLTLHEAARVRAELVADLVEEAGRPPAPPPRPTISLTDYATQWARRKAPRLKESTKAHYADVLGRRVLPVLGSRPVTSLTRADVEEWIAWAEAQRRSGISEGGASAPVPYSQATLGSWWRPLKQLLQDAAAELGFADPTLRIDPPRSARRKIRERRTLTPEQIRMLLDAVADFWPAWRAEGFLGLFSGGRGGELYALRFADLDEPASVIHVARAVWRGHEADTKTHDPRDIALTPAIKAVIQTQRKALIRAQHPGLAAGLIFPAETGGFRGPQALYKVLRQAGEIAGIPVRVGPQVIRRTFNTQLVVAGVDRIVLRAQMGHTSEEMTERYAGIGTAAKVEAVEILHRLVEAADG